MSQKQHTKSSTPGKNSIQSSSSRNIPSSRGGNSGQGQRSQQPAFSSGSVSPNKGRSRSPKQQRQQQNGGSGGVCNLSSSVGGGVGGRARGEMRHAASFDHGFMSTSPQRSFTAPTGHPQQHDFFSPQQPHQNQDHQVVQSSPAFDLLAAKVSGQQQRRQQQPIVDKTVRRLFTADTSSDVTSNPAHSESVPTSLQSIFSQVSTSTADSTTNSNPPLAATNGGTGSDDLPLKVISLEQVEKQMVADVPSPVSINPLTLFGGSSSGVTVSSTAPSLATQPPSTSATAKPSEASLQHHVLLQPSAFMPSTANSATVINPSVNSVAISVEPPSPVVAPGPVFVNGGSTPSSNLKARLLPETTPPSAGSGALKDHFFPPIPPIMHSPGMRAAPVSHVNQPQHPQPQQQLRGEPSSLVSTTTSAPHIAQTSAAVGQGAGKPSQQISSTTATTEERRPPQSTPQRYSSQSTPSVSYYH